MYRTRFFISLLLLVIIFHLFTLPQAGFAAPDDPFGKDAPALDTEAPQPTTLQLGNYSVSEQTGAATYSYPIPVPPGRNSMAPKLSLSYSSRAPLRGGIAAGWSFNLPSIQRDTSLGTLEEKEHFMAMLGGAVGRLVEVPDASIYGGTTYRIEQDDTFTRFERVGSGSDNEVATTCPTFDGYQVPDTPLALQDPNATVTQGWVALTTDGRRHYFGTTPTSTDGVSRWYLTRQVDPHGNTVIYNWQPVCSATGQIIDHALMSISYTSNPNAALSSHARVEFDYLSYLETCPGSQVPVGASYSYRAGRPYYEGARRLLGIVTKVRHAGGWRDVQRITLNYDTAALGYETDSLRCNTTAAPLRFLTQIERVAYAPDNGSTTTLPPVTFTYGAWERKMDTSTTVASVPPHHGTRESLDSTLMDVNGDGVLDRAEVKLSTDGTYSCELVWYQGLTGGGYNSSGMVMPLPTLRWGNDQPYGKERCSLTGQFLYRVNQSVLHDIYGCHALPVGNLNAYNFADVDGDGRVDLLTSLYYDREYYDPSKDSPVTEPIEEVKPPDTPDIAGTWEATSYNRGVNRGPDGQLYLTTPPYPSSKCGESSEQIPQQDGNDYIWRIYRNTGSSFDPMPHFPTKAPIPLRGFGNEGRIGQSRNGSIYDHHAIIDMDGDGRLDLVRDFTHREPLCVEADTGSRSCWVVYPGDGQGAFGAAKPWTATGALSKSSTYCRNPLEGTKINEGECANQTVWIETLAGLRDINGDGLPDYVRLSGVDSHDSILTAYLNTGYGFATQATNLGIQYGLDETAKFSDRFYTYRMLDVDQDGLVDLLTLRGDTPLVYFNVGDRFLPPTQSLSSIWARARRHLVWGPSGYRTGDIPTWHLPPWHVESDYLDANGDGLSDLVEWGADCNLHIQSDDPQGAPPRRLISVNNGVGLITEFHYTPITDDSIVEPGDPTRDRQVPHIFWVVDEISATDAVSSTTATTTYAYSQPIYGSQSGRPSDPRRFLGFTQVTQDLPTGGRVIREYDYDAFVTDGVGDARGRLVREYTYDGDGVQFILVTHRETTYRQEMLFNGLVTFIHPDTKVTRTCIPDADCATQTVNVLRTSQTWQPWSYQNTGGPQLYLRTQRQESAGLNPGSFERQTVSEFRVDYPPAANHYLVLGTRSTRQASNLETISETETIYDDTGNPIEVGVAVDERVAKIVSTYDPETGNLLTVTKPEQAVKGGPSKHIGYDPQQLFVAQTINELGHTVYETHDLGTGAVLERRGPNAKGSVWEKEQWRVDGLGRVVEHAVSLDDDTEGYRMEVVTTTFYMDHPLLGQPRQVIEKQRISFDEPINTEANWMTTTRAFDGRGRDIQKSVVTPKGNAVTDYKYDDGGNLIEIEIDSPKADGDRVHYTYTHDGLGRVRTFRRPLVAGCNSGIDVTYEGLRKIVQEVTCDGSGGHRIAVQDVFGRLVQLKEVGGNSGPGNQYHYDASDNLTEIVDADGNTTKFIHNLAGHRVAIIRGGRTWRYGYDLNGNMVSEVSPVPDGAVPFNYTSWTTYDDLDRVKQRQPAPRELSASQREKLGIGPIKFSYDGKTGPGANAIGRLSHVKMLFGDVQYFDVQYFYDVRGLVTREQRSFSVNYLASASTTQWVERAYNALGQPTRVQHDNGTTWETTYDIRGLPEAVRWFDSTVNAWKQIAQYDRSLAGQVIERGSDFSQSRHVSYDELGRPVHDEIYGGAGMALQAWRDYTYDDSGNLSLVSGETGGISATANYTYDGLHRLLSAIGPVDYTSAFTYSPAGNILTAQVGWGGSPTSRAVRYEYGNTDPQAVDRLVDLASEEREDWASFVYDRSGNMRERSTPLGHSSFKWDGENQLREADSPNGKEAYYYDHQGVRVLAVSTDGVKFWFGASETHFSPMGGPTRRWIHLSSGGPTLARIKNSAEIELQYSDSLQNLILAMDREGNPKASFLYGAFGEVVHASSGDDHRRQFNGKEQDQKTGLSYYGFRYYDPLLLRWNSGDPLYRFVPDIGFTEPQRLNLYTFSLNNPLRYFDPDGHNPYLFRMLGDLNRATEYVERGLKTDVVTSLKWITSKAFGYSPNQSTGKNIFNIGMNIGMVGVAAATSGLGEAALVVGKNIVIEVGNKVLMAVGLSERTSKLCTTSVSLMSGVGTSTKKLIESVEENKKVMGALVGRQGGIIKDTLDIGEAVSGKNTEGTGDEPEPSLLSVEPELTLETSMSRVENIPKEEPILKKSPQ